MRGVDDGTVVRATTRAVRSHLKCRIATRTKTSPVRVKGNRRVDPRSTSSLLTVGSNGAAATRVAVQPERETRGGIVDFTINYSHGESPSTSTGWADFVARYDALLADTSAISFVATFSGCRTGAVRIAIDRVIRRVMTVFGVVRHDQLVGLVTRRHLREM